MAAESTSDITNVKDVKGHYMVNRAWVTKDHEFILAFINVLFFQFCTHDDFGLVFTVLIA